MTDSWWRIVACALATLMLIMIGAHLQSDSAKWQAIGCLKERVAKIEGRLEMRNE